MDRDGVEAVVEVFPESAQLDLLRHVHVGGGYYPYIGFLRFGRTYFEEFSGFQDAQQADLGTERKLGHFIQEDGPSVGFLEITFPRFAGIGERSFFMSEEFGIYRALGYRPAVDGYVAVVFAGAQLVDDFREEFLSRSAFAQYQDAQVRVGNLGGDVYGSVEQGGITDDAEPLFYALNVHDGCFSCTGL